MRFKGKTAIVTGGNSGVGEATARALAAEGATVFIACRRLDAGEEVAQAIRARGEEASAVRCDVTKPDEVTACVQSVLARSAGRIDVLVNAAGAGGQLSAVTEVDEKTWQDLVEVNLGGAFRICRAVIPTMARHGGGAIVLVSSIGGLQAVSRAAPYVASKTGLLGLTRSMALDYASRNIRVNCVCPAFIETPLLDAVIEQQPNPPRTRLAWMSLHPLGRFGKPEEVAAAAAFLASAEAGFITGAVLPVDGGYTAGRAFGGVPEL